MAQEILDLMFILFVADLVVIIWAFDIYYLKRKPQ